jgi:hypothetical protein
MTYLSERQKLHKKSKKIIPNYDNHYRKKRWSKKKYKLNNFNMRGGAAQNIYVFIRPFYTDSMTLGTSMTSDEEIIPKAKSIFYYGDFNLKSNCTSSLGAIDYIKKKGLSKESALEDATFQMLISTFGAKQHAKMISLFPSSNSRPLLNNTRKTNEVYLEEVKTDIEQVKTDSEPIIREKDSFNTESEYKTIISNNKEPIQRFKALRSLVKTNKRLQSIYDYLAGHCFVEFGLILPITKNNFFGKYAYNFDLQDDKLEADITDLTKINEKDLTKKDHERYPQYLEYEAKIHTTTENEVATKLKTDNTMKDEIETLVGYPDFFITRNRINEQIRYRDTEGGSISKNHRLLVTRSTNWKRFNVLTMGLGGDIKSFEDDIEFLEKMREAAKHYIEKTRYKLNWPVEPKDIGLFFHCFPQNSIDVLHLHIVDISTTPVKLSYKNLHIDDVINHLTSELEIMRNNLFLQLQAASNDIEQLKKIETLLKNANATSIKTVDRNYRCSIIIYKKENNWYFEIIPRNASFDVQPAYQLNPELNSLFDEIVSYVKSQTRLHHLNKSEDYGMDSVITTFGGDLWFVCYKLFDILGYKVDENDNNIDQNHYFKYIKLALEELMIAPTQVGGVVKMNFTTPITRNVDERKTPITPTVDDSINLYLCNDSLDNDIDDILAILFIQCMIKKYNKKITLHYREDDTLKWSGLSDTNPEVNKVKTTILDKIYGLKDLTHIFTNKLEPSPRLPNSSTSS